MNRATIKNQLKIYKIILQCTFCIMGQQLNFTSELNSDESRRLIKNVNKVRKDMIILLG